MPQLPSRGQSDSRTPDEAIPAVSGGEERLDGLVDPLGPRQVLALYRLGQWHDFLLDAGGSKAGGEF